MSAAVFRTGALVAIHGLRGPLAEELNGAHGTLRNFDEKTTRWEVDIAKTGFKKLKPGNLLLLTGFDSKSNSFAAPVFKISTGKKKLCRYGAACWQPDFHFLHTDERERCCKWAQHWNHQQTCQSQGCGEPAATETCTVEVQTKPDADVCKAPSLQGLHDAMHDFTMRLEASLRELDCFKHSLTELFAAQPPSINNCSERLVHSDEIQTVAASIDNRFDDFKLTLVKMENRLALQPNLKDVLLSTLEGALQPLAEAFTRKMLDLERRLDSDG